MSEFGTCERCWHTHVPAVCRECGRPVYRDCHERGDDAIYHCQDCIAAGAQV
jgi:hypothetical protein